MTSKIFEFWASLDSFFDNGFGYCVMNDNQIVSLAISGFCYRGYQGIDIETLEPYRGYKLATKVTHAFVQHCFRNDLMPYWDCMKDNIPSNKTAQRVGFMKEFNYVGYGFRLKGC